MFSWKLPSASSATSSTSSSRRTSQGQTALPLNAFGTTDRTCATPDCEWVLEPSRRSNICVVCEDKQRFAKEKERLKAMLGDRAEQRPTCALCARAVVLPPMPQPAQFIICTVCEHKMLAANRSGLVPPSVNIPPHPPSVQQQQPKQRSAQRSVARDGPETDKPRLTIRLPKSKARGSTEQVLAQLSASKPRRGGPISPAIHTPPVHMPSVPQFPRALHAQSASTVQPVHQTLQHQTPQPFPPPPVNQKLARLRAQYRTLEMNIEALMQLDHLNEKGEYNFPQFLPKAPLKQEDLTLLADMAPSKGLKTFSTADLVSRSSSGPSAPRGTPPTPMLDTRVCARPGCGCMLSPQHPWMYCQPCMARAASSVSERPTPAASPSSKPKPASVESPLRIHIGSALPTPPPSSTPSSPEVPLASAVTKSSPPRGHSPRPRSPPRRSLSPVRDEKRDSLWDSDMSELTPLEDSDEDSEVEQQETVSKGKGPARSGNDQSFVCVRSKCQNLLQPWSKWKMCALCRLKFRDRSHERRASERVAAPVAPVEDVGSGTRRCVLRMCKKPLPADYRWKLCEACRTRTRRQARKRRYGAAGLYEETDADTEVEQLRVALGKMPKKLKLTFKGEMVARVDTTDQTDKLQPKQPLRLPHPTPTVPPKVPSVLVPDTVLRYPQYQTATDLFRTLADRFGTFVAAHMQYLRIRAIAAAKNPETQTIPMQPVLFVFEGEFSVVADPAGGEVSSRIHSVQRDIAGALDVDFTCAGYNHDPAGVVAGRFVCAKDVVVPLSPRLQTATKPLLDEDVKMDVDSEKDTLAAQVADENIDIKPDVSAIAQGVPAAADSPSVPSSSAVSSTVPPSSVTPTTGLSSSSTTSVPAQPRSSSLITTLTPPPSSITPSPVPSLSVATEIPLTPSTPASASPTAAPIQRSSSSPSNLPPSSSMPDNSPEPAMKRMSGELEVSVLWDRSHKFFPGMRTIVQFRLVG